MIQCIDHGDVRELRLDRPPANALSPELIAALRTAVEEAPAAGARALVLSGAPGFFSGGLDVPLLIHLDRPAITAAWKDFYAMMRSLAASPIPIAAAITGHSPAGGAVISLYCDARIMAEGAEGGYRIGLNEVQVGIPMPPVIFQALRRQVGSRQAERLCVTAQLVPAAEARRIGLVDELAAPEAVVARAVEWCNALLALPPQALAITRRLARADLVSLFEANDAELATLVDQWFSAETQGAMRALVERLTKKRS
ncbi:MAG TPA: enoyl-CoA hydratase/isomerase family protein [Thermoanaerobaculia bacterium]|jgi:enoyl-CoA hydratase/carnithine racemase|nr:enoyl-CoA hydratase/isomerase family protein [Thermoanaerobaculia bacterium]